MPSPAFVTVTSGPRNRHFSALYVFPRCHWFLCVRATPVQARVLTVHPCARTCACVHTSVLQGNSQRLGSSGRHSEGWQVGRPAGRVIGAQFSGGAEAGRPEKGGQGHPLPTWLKSPESESFVLRT